jgi:photosystem II stability/assembly factor-like uncharacterized protein
MIKRAALIAGLLALTSPAIAQVGGTWEKLNVGQSVIQTGIDFPGNQNLIGYTASMSLTYNGNGNIFRTSDGGQTWTSIWFLAQGGLSGIDFVSVDTGYVCGLPKLASGWSGCGKTTNGGQSWVSLSVPGSNYNFNDIIFRDKNHGLLLTQTNSGAALYVTSDGGSTWISASGVSDGIPNRACYVSGTKYFLVDNSGHIKKSVDDGLSWTTVMTGGPILLGIMFWDDNNGLACGDNGKIFRTTNGGTTWTGQTVTTNIWHQFAYETQNNVYTVGTPEIIYKSTNGGQSWSNNYPQSTYNNAFYDIQFLQNGTAWVCGSQGVLMRRYQLVQAGFTVDSDTVCAGDSATYTAACQGTNLVYTWTFEGGSPSSSALQNPVVKYSAPGSYAVKLKVTNGILTDSLIRQAYITSIAGPPAPVITWNGTLLQSNSVSGNQWFRDGMPIPGANSQTYQPTHTGWHWDVLNAGACDSDTSNNIYIAFTGLDESSISGNTVSFDASLRIIRLDFKGETAATWTASLTDLSGRRLLNRQGISNGSRQQEIIEVSALSAGIYILEFKAGGHRTVKKLILN